MPVVATKMLLAYAIAGRARTSKTVAIRTVKIALGSRDPIERAPVVMTTTPRSP
jgi:hypothetical protein